MDENSPNNEADPAIQVIFFRELSYLDFYHTLVFYQLSMNVSLPYLTSNLFCIVLVCIS